jgi:hypothetical protein
VSVSHLPLVGGGGDVAVPSSELASDASWQLLGWEHTLVASPSSPTSSLRMSAADTILRALLVDFSEHTQLKLEEIMKFGIVRVILVDRAELHFPVCSSFLSLSLSSLAG